VEIVQALLAKGAEVNAKDNKGTTALMGASANGNK
jgi:ankyrin repeat protein